MLVDTLFAADNTRLAKRFALRSDNQIDREPYPHIRLFNSERADVPTLSALSTRLKEVALRGGCVLKGLLDRPLNGESRAGHTSAAQPTDWLLLDLDKISGFQSGEPSGDFRDLTEFFWAILGLTDLEYVVQESASSFISEDQTILSCHAFVRLDHLHNPAYLKLWLKHLNLNTKLRDQITLSKSKTSLRWPLDITTCQNDKLIYVAPPMLEGIAPKIVGDGIYHVEGTTKTLFIDVGIDAVEVERQERELLMNLREFAGLPTKEFKIRTRNGVEHIVDPPPMVVTEYKKIEHRGYAYFNINGGDSWAYYVPLSDPAVVRNFKGEPNFLLKDLSPEIYKELEKTQDQALRQEQAEEVNTQDVARFVIIDDVADSVALVTYTQADPVLDIPKIDIRYTKESLAPHWITEHNLTEPSCYPRWTLINDPSQPSLVIDPKRKLINLYRPTAVRIKAAMAAGDDPIACPEIVHRLLTHVVGNDPVLVDHYINWLACIWQLGRKNLTGWLFSGTQGTGKGVLFSKVLTPMFGPDYVHSTQASILEKEFNHFIEGKQLVLLDEVDLHDSRAATQIMSTLKELITERRISIRRMRTDHYMAENRANFQIATNSRNPMPVPREDRRLNVAERQDIPLLSIFTDTELNEGFSEEILVEFSAYLFQYAADPGRADKIVKTDTRASLMRLGMNTIDNVVAAIKEGDTTFFLDERPPNPGSPTRLGDTLLPPYDEFLKAIFESNGEPMNVQRELLRTVFLHISNTKSETSHKFSKLLGLRGLNSERFYIGPKPSDARRGLKGLVWQITEEDAERWAAIQTDEAPLKGGTLKVVGGKA